MLSSQHISTDRSQGTWQTLNRKRTPSHLDLETDFLELTEIIHLPPTSTPQKQHTNSSHAYFMNRFFRFQKYPRAENGLSSSRKERISFSSVYLFVLFGPSTDWNLPAHIGEKRSLFCLLIKMLISDLFQKHHQRHTQK